jgi:hypothetical protein
LSTSRRSVDPFNIIKIADEKDRINKALSKFGHTTVKCTEPVNKDYESLHQQVENFNSCLSNIM